MCGQVESLSLEQQERLQTIVEEYQARWPEKCSASEDRDVLNNWRTSQASYRSEVYSPGRELS
jgi:hypothetical protein